MCSRRKARVSSSGRSPGIIWAAFFRHACDQLMLRWLELDVISRQGRPVPYPDGAADRRGHFQEFVEDIMPLKLPVPRGWSGMPSCSVAADAPTAGAWMSRPAFGRLGNRARSKLSPRVRITGCGLASGARRDPERRGPPRRRRSGREARRRRVRDPHRRRHDFAPLPGHILHSFGEGRCRRLAGARFARRSRPAAQLPSPNFWSTGKTKRRPTASSSR